MTSISVSARCERCGDSLVCGGLTRAETGRYLIVIHPCPKCDTYTTTPTRPGARTEGQPGRRLARGEG